MRASVIIPARNEEKYIENTLQSLKNQTFKNFEIIVVANKCVDRTIEIAQKYAHKVLILPNGGGATRARNIGAKIAGGDILIFLDADTKMSSRVIERIVRLSKENSIGTCATRPDIQTGLFYLFMLWQNISHKFKLHKGGTGILFCHRNVFFKTEGFKENSWFFEIRDFVVRAEKVGKYIWVNSVCYVITSMRRYSKKGFLGVLKYWIKNWLALRSGEVLSPYEIIR